MRIQEDRLIAKRYRVEGNKVRRGIVELWDATDLQLERPVTVQMLSERASADPDLSNTFLRHQQIACTIHNRAVQAVYDAGLSQTRPFSVLQRPDGISPTTLHRPGTPPDVARALAITRQVAEGLQSCRDAGLAGWALDPENVRIDPEGNAHFAIIESSPADGNIRDDDADAHTLSSLLRLMVVGKPDADIAELRAALVPEVVIGLVERLDPKEGSNITAGAIATDIAAIEAASAQPTQAHEAGAAVVGSLPAEAEAPQAAGAAPVAADSAEAPTMVAPVLTPNEPYNPRPSTFPQGTLSTLPLQAYPPGVYTPPIEKARVTNPNRRALGRILPIAALLLLLLLGFLLLKTLTTPRGVEGQSVNGASSSPTPSHTPALVPDVRGKSLDDARSIAQAAGLNLTQTDAAYDETYPAGKVGSQVPAPGQQVQAGSAITVSLSLGPLPVVNQPPANPQPPASNPPPKKGKGDDKGGDKGKHK